ncbi:MAG: hypothetical protein EXX96DRAFT_499807 [Benjaminiella poitrasii]|nr:MAG: hypothetical protein EXX96DRAFT_499807 [Benjaminiella poitrasii]
MEKWKGSFAQSQLEKFGWASGEGLGKDKKGNAKHINVTMKNDKKGVGVNKGDWEFAWWDHLYNKSASSVVVEKDETKGEIKVAKKSKGEPRRSRTGIISTQRPTGKSVDPVTTATSTPESSNSNSSMSSVADAQNMMDSVKDIHANIAQRLASASLYGSFVKSASTSEAATPNDSDDDELKDYSMKISDAELFAACEGRTARKGGRGLVDQTGKFKRVMKEYVRPTEDKEEKDTKTNKRKRADQLEDESKAAKKAKKAARKAEKEAKKAEKEAKKAEKEAKKVEREAKKAEKEAKKTEKKAKKVEREAKKLKKIEKKKEE